MTEISSLSMKKPLDQRTGVLEHPRGVGRVRKEETLLGVSLVFSAPAAVEARQTSCEPVSVSPAEAAAVIMAFA